MIRIKEKSLLNPVYPVHSVRFFLSVSSVLSVVIYSSSLRADSITTTEQSIRDCKILRVVGGRVIARVGDDAKSFPLADISRVEITSLDLLTQAEDARAQKQWPRAQTLYTRAGRSTSKAVQNLTQARLIEVLDQRGQWADAVSVFLKMYAAEPSDAAWLLRPANLPEEKSVMLPESAKMIEARMREEIFQTVLAQRHMKQLLMDIYLQMNDSRAATLARQLQQGVDGPAQKQVVESAEKKTDAPATQAAAQASGVDHIARQVEEFIAQKKYTEALEKIDTASSRAEGANAAQLAILRGDVQAASGAEDDALMTYIRVSSMNDSGNWGGAALLKTARLQKKLNRDEAAQRLLREVIDKYPDTLWAKEAEQSLAR